MGTVTMLLRHSRRAFVLLFRDVCDDAHGPELYILLRSYGLYLIVFFVNRSFGMYGVGV